MSCPWPKRSKLVPPFSFLTFRQELPRRCPTALRIPFQPQPSAVASGVEETLSGFPASTPPAFRQLAGRNLQALQGFGIRFGSDAGNYLVNLLSPAVNGTPERLARQRPQHKREFVTSEDIWNAVAKGQKDLLHAHNAYITDEAKELAAARGVTLRPRD
jgi:hypothetical protein